MKEYDMDEPAELDYHVNREMAMSKEEIDACTDRFLLYHKADRYDELSTVISTMLQFPDKPIDFNWYSRARSALIRYRVAKNRVEKRTKQLEREFHYKQTQLKREQSAA